MPVSITKTTVTPKHINAMVLKAFGCLPDMVDMMRCECDYRMYDNRWAYDWSGELLLKLVNSLKHDEK